MITIDQKRSLRPTKGDTGMLLFGLSLFGFFYLFALSNT